MDGANKLDGWWVTSAYHIHKCRVIFLMINRHFQERKPIKRGEHRVGKFNSVVLSNITIIYIIVAAKTWLYILHHHTVIILCLCVVVLHVWGNFSNNFNLANKSSLMRKAFLPSHFKYCYSHTSWCSESISILEGCLWSNIEQRTSDNTFHPAKHTWNILSWE